MQSIWRVSHNNRATEYFSCSPAVYLVALRCWMKLNFALLWHLSYFFYSLIVRRCLPFVDMKRAARIYNSE